MKTKAEKALYDQMRYNKKKKEKEDKRAAELAAQKASQLALFENISTLEPVESEIVEKVESGKSEQNESEISEQQIPLFFTYESEVESSLGEIKNTASEQQKEAKNLEVNTKMESEQVFRPLEVKESEIVKKVENIQVNEKVKSERSTERNYLLIAVCFLLAFCAIVILQNDALNFYLSERSVFTLWNMFSSADGTNALALLKSSVPEIFMFFIGIAPAKNLFSKMAKWGLILTIAAFQIASVAINTLDSSQESVVEMKSKIQKQLAQSDVVSTLKKQESELVNSLALANSSKEGSANIWVVRSITRKLSETRESLKVEIQKQEIIPVDEIQKKIDRVQVKNLMFVIYRVIIFASSLFLMSFLSKLIFSPEEVMNKKFSTAS